MINKEFDSSEEIKEQEIENKHWFDPKKLRDTFGDIENVICTRMVEGTFHLFFKTSKGLVYALCPRHSSTIMNFYMGPASWIEYLEIKQTNTKHINSDNLYILKFILNQDMSKSQILLFHSLKFLCCGLSE